MTLFSYYGLFALPGMVPYPEPYQSQYQQHRLGALGIEWRPSLIKYAVGPDYSVGLDEVIPLADLERNVEPLPEFIDAMYMEPEIEVGSDDNDSEYNANEDNSSEAEQRSMSDISSSDLEGGEDDNQAECSNRDGLRRSRRKKHNVGVSGVFIFMESILITRSCITLTLLRLS